jgi:hypothetical protein
MNYFLIADVVMSPRYWNLMSIYREISRYLKQHRKKAVEYLARSRKQITFYKQTIVDYTKGIIGNASNCHGICFLSLSFRAVCVKDTGWLTIILYGNKTLMNMLDHW